MLNAIASFAQSCASPYHLLSCDLITILSHTTSYQIHSDTIYSMLSYSDSVARCQAAPITQTFYYTHTHQLGCADPTDGNCLLTPPRRATVSSVSSWAFRVCHRAFLEKYCLFCVLLSHSVPCLPHAYDPQPIISLTTILSVPLCANFLPAFGRMVWRDARFYHAIEGAHLGQSPNVGYALRCAPPHSIGVSWVPRAHRSHPTTRQ